jgi:hypothetical protein
VQAGLRHIEPFAESAVRPGVISYGVSSYGYDVRVGRHFKVFTNARCAVVDPKNFDPASFVDFEGDSCLIPPNSFALAETVDHQGRSGRMTCSMDNVSPLENLACAGIALHQREPRRTIQCVLLKITPDMRRASIYLLHERTMCGCRSQGSFHTSSSTAGAKGKRLARQVSVRLAAPLECAALSSRRCTAPSKLNKSETSCE